MQHDRRGFMAFALAGAGIAAAARAAPAAPRFATAPQMLGPYYPVVRPLIRTPISRVSEGRRERARATIINLVGRVLDRSGRPVPGARIDVWQANAAGRYGHPGDSDCSGPLDRSFQGSAVMTADAEGCYRLRTIKPGACGSPTPDIHFDVTGGTQRLVTQMYFPGEAANASDGLLSQIPDRVRST